MAIAYYPLFKNCYTNNIYNFKNSTIFNKNYNTI